MHVDNGNVSTFASRLAERLMINPVFHTSQQSKTDRELEMQAAKAGRGKADDYKNLYKKINNNARFKKAVIPTH